MQKCYMCSEDAITREHAPPESFFREGERENLITVSSCKKHNNENSKDVEYVKNIINSEVRTNSNAREHFKEKTVRAWNRREGSFAKRVFKDSISVKIVNEEFPAAIETKALTIELDRFYLIFECMANALYFNDFKERFTGKWLIFFPNFVSKNYLTIGAKDNQDELVEDYLPSLESLSYEQKEAAHPNVFQYFIHQEDKNIIYKFLFYEGFVVYMMNA